MKYPFVHVVEPMADGTFSQEHMFIELVSDLITYMDFATNERDLRY